MKTVYKYTDWSNPIVWVLVALTVVYVGFAFFFFIREGAAIQIVSSCLYVIFGAYALFCHLTGGIEIDDDSGILTLRCSGKATVDISKIDRIARHVGAKGHVKYLTVHEAGVKYLDIKVNLKDEESFLAHIQGLNPGITVVTYRF